jgi:hypothetical protein
MKLKQAIPDDQATLLALMHESFEMEEAQPPGGDWAKTAAALTILLSERQAGEAYLIFDTEDQLIGYVILSRGFSLEQGGYFTWIEETYVRKPGRGRFRDQIFAYDAG